MSAIPRFEHIAPDDAFPIAAPIGFVTKLGYLVVSENRD